MTPTTHDIGRTLVTTPRLDQITDLSASDRAAVNAGADLGQVVNVRRKAAGLVVGSSVMYRGQRLTPQGCLSLASDRADALNLLRAHGYVT